MHLNPVRKGKSFKKHRKNRRRNDIFYKQREESVKDRYIRDDVTDDEAIELIAKFNKKRLIHMYQFTFRSALIGAELEALKALMDFKFERNGPVTRCICIWKIVYKKRPRLVVDKKYYNTVVVAEFKSGVLQNTPYLFKKDDWGKATEPAREYLKYVRKSHKWCSSIYAGE